MELAKVLDVLRGSDVGHEWRPGATAARIAEAERRLGRSLPESLAALYRETDGGDFLLGLYPLLPDGVGEDELTLATASDLLRSWGWPVPEEMLVFATDGAESLVGMWVPRDGPPVRPIVVAIGEVFEPPCLAVVGTSLAAFLAALTAFYLPLSGGDVEALEPLGVPAHLLGLEDDEDAVAKLMHWASPDLPDSQPDPYQRGLTREEVDAFARG